MTKNREAFRKNLAHLMVERKCTQEDIARSVGVCPSAVSHWYLGISIQRGDTMVKLANFFGVSPSTMIGSYSLFTTMNEEKLLADFRKLSPVGQEKALERMHELKQLYWYENG